MHRLKDRALRPQVRSRNQPQPTHKRAAKIAQNIPVQILRQQNVVLVRIHHQLHAGVVDDVLRDTHLRKPSATPSGSSAETAHPTAS